MGSSGLALTFANGGKLCRATATAVKGMPDDEIAKLVDGRRSELADAVSRMPPRQQRLVEDQLDQYLIAWGQYQRALRERKTRPLRTVTVGLRLANAENSAVTGISLRLQFPDNVVVGADLSQMPPVTEPRLPGQMPKPEDGTTRASIHRRIQGAALDHFSSEIQRLRGDVWVVSGTTMTASCDQLAAGSDVLLMDFWVAFPMVNGVLLPFEVDVTLAAAEPATAETDKLRFEPKTPGTG